VSLAEERTEGLMANHKFDLSLRLNHPSDDLRPIASALGTDPEYCWKKGDRFPVENGRTRSESYCSVTLMKMAKLSSLDDAIATLLMRLEGLAAEFERLSKSGGRAAIAIHWIAGGDGGETISNNLLLQLGRLHLSMDVYIYFDPKLNQ